MSIPKGDARLNLKRMRLIDEQYLLHNLAITKPGQVGCADIIYIPIKRGFLFLVAIMDWYSRKVLSWWLFNTITTAFCVEALEKALSLQAKPEIFNIDQGSQFIPLDFTCILKDNEIKISMDGKGRWIAFYRAGRPHSTFNERTPDKVYNKRNFVPSALGYALPRRNKKKRKKGIGGITQTNNFSLTLP